MGHDLEDMLCIYGIIKGTDAHDGKPVTLRGKADKQAVDALMKAEISIEDVKIRRTLEDLDIAISGFVDEDGEKVFKAVLAPLKSILPAAKGQDGATGDAAEPLKTADADKVAPEGNVVEAKEAASGPQAMET